MVRLRGPLSKAPKAGTSATLDDHYLRPPLRPLRSKQHGLLLAFVVKREPSPAPVSLVTQAHLLPPQRQASKLWSLTPQGREGGRTGVKAAASLCCHAPADLGDLGRTGCSAASQRNRESFPSALHSRHSVNPSSVCGGSGVRAGPLKGSKS